jgi:hypothetical protein
MRSDAVTRSQVMALTSGSVDQQRLCGLAHSVRDEVRRMSVAMKKSTWPLTLQIPIL